MTTFNEQNIENITIQKSENGFQFTDFINVDPKNLLGKNTYNLKDEKPFAITYYRAIIKDNNGKLFNSNIIKLNDRTRLNVVIFPNPFNNQLNIKIEEEVLGEIEISVESISGQQMFYQKLNGKNKQLNYNLEHLSKGTYFIKIKTQDKSLIKKILKN